MCARLTCPRSPFYQPLLPPSGTKNCVIQIICPSDISRIFHVDPTTRRTFPFAIPISTGTKNQESASGSPFSTFAGGRNFFLVKYDGRQTPGAPRGDFVETLARFSSRGTGRSARRRDPRLRAPPGRAKREKRRRSSSSTGDENRRRAVARSWFRDEFPRSGTPPRCRNDLRPDKASLTLMWQEYRSSLVTRM